MGWYVRKSLNWGLLRINLSKRGLGTSAGVKGARVGVDATGKPYVHTGRFGLYYRKRLDLCNSRQPSEQQSSIPIWVVILAIILTFGLLIVILR